MADHWSWIRFALVGCICGLGGSRDETSPAYYQKSETPADCANELLRYAEVVAVVFQVHLRRKVRELARLLAFVELL
jgi:hypothetical protein